MRKRFNVTYDVVTPESAEHGDTAEAGFVCADESRIDMANIWGEEAGRIKAQCAMSLREALSVFGHGGAYEEGGNGSIYQADPIPCYRTGAETRYALHFPDKITGASYSRVKRIIDAR